MGLCQPGEFTAWTATAIVDLICLERDVDQLTAYKMGLDAVVAFLNEKAAGAGPGNEQAAREPPPSANAAGEGDTQRWLTVSEAAQVAGCNKGVITKAVNAGELKGNGLEDRKRRIDAAALAHWMLARAGKPEPVESDEAVERQVKKHVRD